MATVELVMPKMGESIIEASGFERDTLLVDILVDDQGNEGSGGSQSSVGTVFITVNPVSAVPTLGNNTLSISEGGTVTISSAELSATDDDGDPLTFNVSGITGRQIELTGKAGVPPMWHVTHVGAAE